jgi:hypothetical protein
MTADLLAALPSAVLVIHVAVIAFSVFGLIAISLAQALGIESHKILRRITPATSDNAIIVATILLRMKRHPLL